MKTKLNRTEVLVQKLFAERYGLELQPIPRSNTPTPDFEVFHEQAHRRTRSEGNGRHSGDDRRIQARASCSSGHRAAARAQERQRRKPCGKKLHEAVEQLAGVEVGKVVVFVNEEEVLDRDDLREVLQGFLRFGDEKVTSLTTDVAKRLAEDRMKADLYVWMDVHGANVTGVTIWPVTDVGIELRQRAFSERR